MGQIIARRTNSELMIECKRYLDLGDRGVYTAATMVRQKSETETEREARLAEALRANLQRRKAQKRARTAPKAPPSPDQQTPSTPAPKD